MLYTSLCRNGLKQHLTSKKKNACQDGALHISDAFLAAVLPYQNQVLPNPRRKASTRLQSLLKKKQVLQNPSKEESTGLHSCSIKQVLFRAPSRRQEIRWPELFGKKAGADIVEADTLGIVSLKPSKCRAFSHGKRGWRDQRIARKESQS